MLSQEGVSPPFQTISDVNAISPVHPGTYPPPAESAWAAVGDGLNVSAGATGEFTGANVVKFTVTLQAKATEDTEVKVALTLDGATNTEFDKSVTVVVKEGQTSADGTIVVDQAGDYTLTATSSATLANTTTVDVNITPDTAADALWSQGKADLNVDPDVDGTVYFDWTGSAVDLKVEELIGYDLNEINSSNYQVAWYKDNDGAGSADKDFDKADARLDSAPKDTGKYLFTIWPAGDLDKGTFASVSDPIVIPVEIVKAGVESYSFYQVNPLDGSDVSDTTFTFDGDNWLVDEGKDGVFDRVGLAVDGKATKLYKDGASVDQNGTYYYASEIASSADAAEYTVAVYKKEISNIDGDSVKAASLTAGSKVGDFKFTVAPFDLSKAAVVVDDQDLASESSASNGLSGVSFTYDGVTFDGIEFAAAGGNNAFDDTETDRNPDIAGSAVKLTVESFEAAKDSTAPYGYDGKFGYWGTYEVSFEVLGTYNNTPNSPDFGKWTPNYSNFTMSGDAPTATVRVAKTLASAFTYEGTPISATYGETSDKAIEINLTEGESFDAKEIGWTLDGTKKYDGKNATIKFYTAAGEEVSSVDATGLYKVVVSINPDRAFQTAGSESFWINVTNGTATNVIVTVDGKVCTTANEGTGSATVSYTGSAIDWSVLVKDSEAGKVLTAGTDYKVEIRDADANVVVDEILAPGNYTITVTGAAYNVTKTVVNVSVLPAAFDGAVIEQQTFGYDQTEYERPYSYTVVNGNNVSSSKELTVAQATGIAYTGEAVTPVVKAYVEKVVNGDVVKAYTELDPSMYTVTYADSKGNAVKAEDLKKAGSYTATIALSEEFDEEFGKSATVAGKDSGIELGFNIVDTIAGGFSDVKASEWYADEATKAKQLGYMTGLSGTRMLLPNADITRADVCMVLMRMAGGDPDLEKGESYPTKFADVEADAYYAKAIDWAYKAGIVTGYDGSSNFGPNDLVTREQLATMLGRFAENVMGEDVSAGEIDGYVDAGSVQEFAVEGMSWCVENGVFGVNTDVLDPQGNASRAQVAAIAVRVMPAVEK